MTIIDKVNIPKNNPIEQKRLIDYVSRYVGQEFSNMTTPCYYLKMSKVWRDIVFLTGIDKSITTEFKNRFPSSFESRKIFSDQASALLLITILYYMKNNKKEYAKLFYRLLSLKFYASTIHKFMDFCNPEVWNFSIDRISSKHLFKTKNGVSNGILYLSDVEFEKKWIAFKKGIKYEDKFINDLIYNLRHRINQSFRSFANSYFKYAEDKGILIRAEREDEVKQDNTMIPDKISISITTHRQIDKESVFYAIKKSSIQPDLGIYIVDKISDVSNRETLRFILVLLDRIIELNKICIERDRNLLIRKVMANSKINKYFVRTSIEEFLNGVDVDYKIRTANSLQTTLFFVNYIINYIQKRICI